MERMQFHLSRFPLALALALTIVAAFSCRVAEPRHLVHDFPSRNPDGSVNAIIEIPAGTTAKYEVEKQTGQLEWEVDAEGVRRNIDFLPYPANYGLVPATLLDERDGGDGDPLDVVVLGSAVERGRVVPVRVIAALSLLDGGEIDDKLIAVAADGTGEGITSIRDLDELQERYPNAASILELWFGAYKGPGAVVVNGWLSAREANAVLERAEKAYAASRGDLADPS
jgi:inorganic pyrophosphatase